MVLFREQFLVQRVERDEFLGQRSCLGEPGANLREEEEEKEEDEEEKEEEEVKWREEEE